MKYSLSPERYSRRLIAISGTSRARRPFSFDMVSVTSAMFSALRVSVPLKMMSSIDSARSERADCSPTTHLIASTTLDLPQPLGPSRAEIPSENSTFALSAKLLKPNISRLFRNTRAYLVPSWILLVEGGRY
jgi:hypothetical protein